MFSNIAACRDFCGGSNTNIGFPIGKHMGSIAVDSELWLVLWSSSRKPNNVSVWSYDFCWSVIAPVHTPMGICASFVTTCYRKCHDEPLHERCSRLIDQEFPWHVACRQWP